MATTTPLTSNLKSLSEGEALELFEKVDIRVGKILSVAKHPNADKLYIEKVDFGGDETELKTVVSGLVLYFSPEELQNKLCLFVFNLKPQELKSIQSQAMILVAHETPGSKVELLVPPLNCVPGDRVCLLDTPSHSSREFCPEILNPKKKIFENVKAHLSIDKIDGRVLFLNKHAWGVLGKGPVSVPSIREGCIS